MDSVVVVIPLLPLLAALIIGIGQLPGIFCGKAQEAFTAKLSLSALTLVLLASFSLIIAEQLGKSTGNYFAGIWLKSEALTISLNFITAGFNIQVTLFSALLLLLIVRLSINQLQLETGYHRYFMALNGFAGALFLLLLSDNLLLIFIGWYVTSLCAYILIAYAFDQPVAAINATRVFLTHRLGDAGFLLGIGLSYSWIGSFNLTDLIQAVGDLELNESTILALCFAIAACARSAQIPFSPWLARAMEGPTASTAVFFGALFTHSGIFLLITLRSVLLQSPIAMTILVVLGALTALYSWVVSLTQTDIKSALSFAISGQLGLIAVECGLGYWQLAVLHSLVHMLVRTYQLLHTPGFLQQTQGIPVSPLMPVLAKMRWAYVVSLQRFWLDPLTDWLLVNPVLRLGKDLSYFDDHIVNVLMGVPTPAMNALATLAQLEEQRMGVQLENEGDSFARGNGLAGKLAESMALILQWIEQRLVMQGFHGGTIRYGQQVGMITNRIEQLLVRPRYLSLFVFITLLVVF
ncbi:MAG: proton-conducting transporter membrane subunit [Methylococcales bacterium]